ncbi:MAG TPA: PadR family transcriptional regulator [Verrucomicrobiae bacterium]|nr:PadR family transcriptional regulator [Verrucomicrobiae bacterium]
MYHRHLKRQRCMRGPRHGEGFGHEHEHERGHWGRRGHRHGGGLRRMFDHGDLKFVVLALIAEQPRHGYEIIKEIEHRVGGAYAPSPGVIYPLLTMLEEMGLAQLSASEGAKKLYAITEQGQAELASNKANVDALFARIASARETFSGGRSPQIVRAMENLKVALRLRMERGPLSEAQLQDVAAAIDAAAQAIERS